MAEDVINCCIRKTVRSDVLCGSFQGVQKCTELWRVFFSHAPESGLGSAEDKFYMDKHEETFERLLSLWFAIVPSLCGFGKDLLVSVKGAVHLSEILQEFIVSIVC